MDAEPPTNQGGVIDQTLMWVTQQNRLRRSWILAHRRRKGRLYGRAIDPSLFTQTKNHSYYGISTHLAMKQPHISKINRHIRKWVLTSKRNTTGDILRVIRSRRRGKNTKKRRRNKSTTTECSNPQRLQATRATTQVKPSSTGPRRGGNTSQKNSQNKITIGECSNQQRPPRRRQTSKAKGNARGSRQAAKTTVKKRRPEINGGKHVDQSRPRRKRAKIAAQVNVTEQSEVPICGSAVENGFCHQSGRVFTSVWNFGRPTEICEFCDAVLWKEESVGNVSKNGQLQFNICCQKGKVKLPLLQDPPEYLKELIDPNGGRRSSEFRRLIRSYNTIYAFTSMGGKVDNAINQGSSPYCFRLGGQNHHNIGSFLPPDGKQPRFLQLYFYDGESEVSHRITSLSARGKNELDPEIVEGLSNMLYEHNALAKMCKMAKERLEPSSLQPVQLRLIGNRSMDGRQYNLPSSDELAVLIVGGGDLENCNRDIVIYDRSSGVKKISELHPSFMAMQYPLMFPYGEDGYRPDIKHSDAETTTRKKRTFVTMREYYAFRFQERRKLEQIIDGISVLCGRLRQQFMVDTFTCVEETRCRSNQNEIRKYSLRGLIDAIASGNISPGTLGQSMILPASFPGCFRFLFQNYQDALAICRWAGPPDLFITFTCNPKWAEIKEFLDAHPGQRPEDRPDIVARVFKIKLDALIHDLTKDAFFGRVLAVIYTVEFQKRGLPHAHICLFLHPSDKHKDPADIDKIISAEIPDKDIDPVGV